MLHIEAIVLMRDLGSQSGRRGSNPAFALARQRSATELFTL